MLTDLCKVAVKHRSDRTPSIGGHAYTPYYYELFGKKDVRKLLEIGIDQGKGLRMWEEYFPRADIYGLDALPELLINEGRIKSFYCDLRVQTSIISAASQVGDKLDLVFDDASHDPWHQVDAAKIFVPLLNRDGIYIIEDVGYSNTVLNQLQNYHCEVKEFHVNQLSLDDDRLIIIRGDS